MLTYWSKINNDYEQNRLNHKVKNSISGRYQIQAKLGEGSYGVVYKVFDLNTSQMLALKQIKIDEPQEGIPSTTLREISILQMLDHPNIVK